MITPAQCRAARALLGWSQDALAENASVSTALIQKFEAMIHTPKEGSLKLISHAFEQAGIRFIGRTGVDLPA